LWGGAVLPQNLGPFPAVGVDVGINVSIILEAAYPDHEMQMIVINLMAGPPAAGVAGNPDLLSLNHFVVQTHVHPVEVRTLGQEAIPSVLVPTPNCNIEALVIVHIALVDVNDRPALWRKHWH
jgi:hypothetical protein